MSIEAPTWKRHLRKGTVLLAGSSAMLLAAACGGTGEINPGPSATATAATPSAGESARPTSEQSTDPDLYCNDTLSHDDYPAAKGRVVADGRCDGDPEAPIGVYPDSRIEKGKSRAVVKTGAVLVAICKKDNGERIQNVALEASRTWIKVDLGKAYEADENDGLIEKKSDGNEAYIAATWANGADEVKEDC